MFKTLVSAVSEQCQEIKQALASLEYFETWEPDVIAECCRVSSVSEYPPDKIILGPDTGNSHMVYFIIEGVCRMVQHMHIKIKKGSAGFRMDSKEIFRCKRYRFADSKVLNSESKNEGFKSRLLNLGDNFRAVKISGVNEEVERDQPAELSVQPEEEPEVKVKESEENERGADFSQENQQENAEICKTDTANNSKENQKIVENSDNTLPDKHKSESSEEQDTKIPEVNYEPDHHLKILEECKKRRNELMSVCNKGALPGKLKNVKSVFIQTGFLLKGACFGLEKCENFIMSYTKVKCLKIPQRFLLKHNPCNVWNRIRLFHALYLPKDDRIFENFRSDRLWTEWKKKLSREIVSRRNIPNYTLISDVPYSLRLADIR